MLIDGTPVATQADVKQRWPDGSVKHAILSVLVPTIPANGSVTLTFQNQADGNNTPLSQSDMLASNFDFDAVLQIASGTDTRSASARTMLTDGSFTCWTSGPIATTVILADHSAARAYDMGFDDLRSIRPIFEATFWPGINKVRVRFIGENTDSEALEDVAYDITLKTGLASPQTVYTKTGYVHKAATRWTKVFWIGGTPESRINIDNNLAYLVQTRFLPNYDTSLVVPESVIADRYTAWQTADPDIQDGGWWCKYMPTTGGRRDIGHMPDWVVQWLYTGDYRMKEATLGNADLAANWTVQVREGDPGRFYDRAQTIPAIGKPVSICARPQLWIFDGRGGTDPSYWIPVNGTRLDTPGGEWTYDNAHQADPFSAAYMLTGDHWYLEELQMWASYSVLNIWPAPRGPTGYAGLVDQVRGDAWAFRNRVNAAFLSPDNTPEKGYFQTVLDDAIAEWEGWHNVPGTFSQSRMWQWARSHAGVPYGLNGVSPLHVFDYQNSPHVTAPWQNHFVMMELGITREKGFPVNGIDEWLSEMLTDQFYVPGYCVYRIGSYWIPISYADGTWMTSWLESQDAMNQQGYTDDKATSDFTHGIQDTQHGYPVIASAAAALNACYPGADVVWDFVETNVRDANVSGFSANPKWAINPRGQIRKVGPGQTYATVQAAVDAANDFDVIQIFPGTYTKDAGWADIAKNNLTFIGMGSSRPVLDAAGSSLSGKGIFVISGHDTIVQNIEFANARDAATGSAAGLVLQGRNLTVSGCCFRDNDNGVVADAMSSSSVTIDGSEFNHNGSGNGLSHNINIGPVDAFSMKYCWVHNANAGCEVRTLARSNMILYSRIGNEGGTGTFEIQAPNGGTTYVLGNQIEQGATGTNPTIIDYGSEGTDPDMHLCVASNTIVNNNASAGTFVNNASGTDAVVQNNIFQGTGTVLTGPGTPTSNWATADAKLAIRPTTTTI